MPCPAQMLCNGCIMKERFGLYLIATDPVAGYEAVAMAAVECGVRYLQLRMKNTPRETVVDTAHMFRAITLNTRTRFIVNDDLDVAMEVDADGIHLGQMDMPLPEARNSWNTPGKIFGLSTHCMAQAIQSQELKPDYIGIGPVYATQTKTDADPALGPIETGRIAKHVPITSVGIGGINSINLPEVLEAGIDNFCVVGAVNAYSHPASAIRNLQMIWKMHNV